MGWCSGTYVAEEWFDQIKKRIKPADQRQATYEMIEALQNQDWDCEDDFEDPLFQSFYAEWRRDNGYEE